MSRRTVVWGATSLIVSCVFLLLFLTGAVTVTVSANMLETTSIHAREKVMLSTQDTPTVDPTLTTLQKEQLIQQVNQLNNQNNTWAWTVIGSFGGIIGGLGTIFLAIVGIFTVRSGFKQWQGNRKDDLDNRNTEQERWNADLLREREKRDEERFQTAITGLGSGSTGTKIGAAIILRTFLEPGYERFHRQIFDLAVAYLRLQDVPPDASKPIGVIAVFPCFKRKLQDVPPDASKPIDPLNQALVTLFKESFSRVFTQASSQDAKFNPESLNATGIHMDKAYLRGFDLKQVWMPEATLRRADLTGVELNEANLTGTDFTRANLQYATLTGANLTDAIFTDADLTGADLRGANLAGTHPEKAKSLQETVLINVIEFDDSAQRQACEKRGAIFVDLSSNQQPGPNTS